MPPSSMMYKFAIATLVQGALVFAQAETCSNTQLSCNASPIPKNTCCYESPGGLIQQVQFWDTDPSTGPSKSWTIHGLWPNNCDGTYNENCDKSRAYTNITQILKAAGDTDTLDYMQTYWLSDDESNEAFWDHEWETHGTCMSTLATDCYTDYEPGDEVVDFFDTTVALFKTLDTYTILANAGITPSSDTTYSLSDMNDALEKSFGAPVILQCDDSTVYEIYYGFNVMGSIQGGDFVPTEQTGSSTNCPDTISYPPKS